MEKNNLQRDFLTPPSGLPIYYSGPKLDNIPLPSLFYFALSGEESLHLDPYNQPAIFLKDKPIRVFSSTLPCHGSPHERNTDAMHRWALELQKGNDIIAAFISQCRDNLTYLIEQGYTNESKVAAAGLSRGGFAATHFAAEDPRISHVLGYAPLTTFSTIQEFHIILESPLVKSKELKSLISKLIKKKLRYYIGNLDTRVGTPECFEFIHQLTNQAFHHKVRSPQIELIISPSIGYKGHGTSPEIFRAGTEWISKEFLNTHN
jgi:hypothetical protein